MKNFWKKMKSNFEKKREKKNVKKNLKKIFFEKNFL